MVMSWLGEPDPSSINRHDLLSSIAFDKTGKLLSVGDRGGRVITFKLGENEKGELEYEYMTCLLYTSPSPRDRQKSRMPSSA